MNLHDLYLKAHRSVTATAGIEAGRLTVDEEVLLGLTLPANQDNSIVLRGALEHAHFGGRDDVGFSGRVLNEGVELETASMQVSYSTASETVSRITSLSNRSFQPVTLPNVLDLEDPFAAADLVIEVPAVPYPVFLGSSRRTPREALYKMARGTGIEIGPGPRPQILSGPDTDVTYVEEMAADAWAVLYGANVSKEAWENQGYRIGKAHDLPVQDHSLDFIFSSHVIEHLYNPLGHFEHWRAKLKKGGVVLAVVPSTEGTKDFVFPRTSIVRLIEEYESREFASSLATYEEWVRVLQPASDVLSRARKLYQEKFSIHVHVYDHASMSELLQACVKRLGYTKYRMFYRRNSKDFLLAIKA